MGLSYDMGHVMMRVSFFALLLVVNVCLAEIASWRFGRFLLWLLAFFLLPGLAHVFYLVALMYVTHRERLWWGSRRVFSEKAQVFPWSKPQAADGSAVISVTPFTATGEASGTTPATGAFDILNEWRDERIDDLRSGRNGGKHSNWPGRDWPKQERRGI